MAVDNWKQRALVKITPLGGTGINASINTKDLQIGGGEWDVKAEANLQGGNMVSFTPQAPFELTLDNIQFSTDDYDKLFSDGTLARKDVRVVITWVDDPSVTDAEAATTAETYRNVFNHGYVVSFDKKFSGDDGVLIGTLKIKVPARNLDGTESNGNVEYNASGLSAVPSYS